MVSVYALSAATTTAFTSSSGLPEPTALMMAAADQANRKGAPELIWAVFKPNKLAVEVTLTDPLALTRPWTSRKTFTRRNQPLLEPACG